MDVGLRSHVCYDTNPLRLFSGSTRDFKPFWMCVLVAKHCIQYLFYDACSVLLCPPGVALMLAVPNISPVGFLWVWCSEEIPHLYVNSICQLDADLIGLNNKRSLTQP